MQFPEYPSLSLRLHRMPLSHVKVHQFQKHFCFYAEKGIISDKALHQQLLILQKPWLSVRKM